jgi:hypothetical protein
MKPNGTLLAGAEEGFARLKAKKVSVRPDSDTRDFGSIQSHVRPAGSHLRGDQPRLVYRRT